MNRDELLRELRECASLADREIAEARAREALIEYAVEHVEDWSETSAIGHPADTDDEITAAYRAAIHRPEGEEQDD